MNVRRPARVPAGIDGLETNDARRIGHLDAPQPGLARGAFARKAGVVTGRVVVPDVADRAEVLNERVSDALKSRRSSSRGSSS